MPAAHLDLGFFQLVAGRLEHEGAGLAVEQQDATIRNPGHRSDRSRSRPGYRVSRKNGGVRGSGALFADQAHDMIAIELHREPRRQLPRRRRSRAGRTASVLELWSELSTSNRLQHPHLNRVQVGQPVAQLRALVSSTTCLRISMSFGFVRGFRAQNRFGLG